ncbi:hypothetical protein [Leifsonia sp. Leaf264]|uniref:hypothetical protein n=1 Tax=Leifsonia sp. Leaf264 TaxID=1736314 RepID=UPI0007001902|nr:hypothetical protein [Leifsonia sp. Leaf264]KQO97394.1 hypothetical protein ASF30_13165 [Leifsonia sp. Leaf264]
MTATEERVEPKSSKKDKAAVAPKQRSGSDIAIGGVPRVDLLPAEVRSERTSKRLHRRIAVGVVLLAVLVVIGIAASTLAAITSAANLAIEQQRTNDLLLEQQKYSEIRQVQQQTTALTDAQRIGAWTEIDWKDYLQALTATLPATAVITDVSVDSASPLAEYTQATAPLQGPKVASVALSVTSTELPSVPDWIDRLATLPGFADAVPSAITGDATTGQYQVSVVIHVNKDAFRSRFKPEPAATDSDATATTGDSE